jgi:hypothetical protein
VWLIAVSTVIVAMVLVLVWIRHFTSPAFIENLFASAMGPNYRVHVGSSSFDPLSRRFVAHDISIQPDTLSLQVREGELRTRYSLMVSTLRASGVDLWGLSRERIVFASVEIDTPRVEIYLDRTVPDSTEVAPSTLPHVLLLGLERPLRIDTIRIVGGDLLYVERADDGERAGTFQFADLNANISHVTNDTTRMGTPCSIEVRSRLANAGQLDAVFEYDFRSKALAMNYRGTVGKIGALSLNELLVDLEGFRITAGVIDTTSFAFEVKDDVASGTLRVLYHDIAYEVIDKNSLEQGLKEHFGSMLYKSKSHASNPEDDEDPPTEITIRRVREPHVSLIKFVWETIREGLLRTLGVQ